MLAGAYHEFLTGLEYCEVMVEAKRYNNAVGWLGVLCFSVFWAAAFVPGIRDLLPDSSFGKFVVFGTILASAPLTITAVIRDSRWWLVAVAASLITLAVIYVRFDRVLT